MSQSKYIREDYASCLGRFIEECGEALAAAGKTMRWGLDSVNPELPREQQETNEAWLRREIADVQDAAAFLLRSLDQHADGAPNAT